jgi:hypothetical protein
MYATPASPASRGRARGQARGQAPRLPRPGFAGRGRGVGSGPASPSQTIAAQSTGGNCFPRSRELRAGKSPALIARGAGAGTGPLPRINRGADPRYMIATVPEVHGNGCSSRGRAPPELLEEQRRTLLHHEGMPWLRLKRRTLDCDFRIPVKMMASKRT